VVDDDDDDDDDDDNNSNVSIYNCEEVELNSSSGLRFQMFLIWVVIRVWLYLQFVAHSLFIHKSHIPTDRIKHKMVLYSILFVAYFIT
jgi:hypothetical protein